MIVCHCHAVNDRTIRSHAEQGALTAEEIASRCGAGARCGGCRISVDDLVDEVMARRLGTAPSASGEIGATPVA